MSHYLAPWVKQMDEYDDGMLISQEGYAKEVLNKFKMLHCNPWNVELKLFTVVSIEVKERVLDSKS